MSAFDTQTATPQSQQPIATNTHLELSVDAGGIGLWYWDAPANKLFWSDQQHRLYGLAPGSFEGNVEAFHALVIPEDLQALLHNNSEVDNGINADYEYRFRIRRPDGSIRWMLARSRTSFSADGVLQHITGINIDITEQQQAQEQLAASEAFSRTALESSPDCVKILDLQGRLQYMNANGVCLMELDDFETLKGRPWQVLWPKAEQPKVTDAVGEALAGHKAQFQAVCPTGKGTLKWWDVIVQPVHDEKGGIRQIISVSRDVTRQKKAEAALKASEERYQNFMQRSSEGIWRFELEQPLPKNLPVPEQIAHMYRYAYLAECNDAMARMYGYSSAKELTGVRLPDFFPADADSEAYFTHFIEQGYRAQNIESKEQDKQGNIRFFQNNLVGIEENGMLLRAWGTQVDITEKKKIEDKIRQSEELFRTFSDNIHNLAWMADGEGWIWWYNQRWYDYTGTTLEEMQGWGWQKVHHPDHMERVVSFVKEAWKKPQAWELTFPLRGVDGVYRWFLTRAEPVVDSEGKIIRWIGTNTNINEQKLAEETATKSNERFELINKATQDAIWDWNLETNEVHWNEALYELFGYTPGQVEKTAEWWHNHVHPDDQERVAHSIHEVIDAAGKKWVSEYRFICADGSYKTVFDRGFILHNEKGKSVRMLGSMQDITSRKKAEETIRESEARFRSMANDTPAFMFMADAETNVEFVNKTWLDFVGLQSQQGFGKVWETITHPDDVAPMYAVYKNAVATLQPYEFHIRQRNREGQYRWILFKGIPRKNEDGSFGGVMGVGFDVTEQKEAEDIIRKSEERFRQLADLVPQIVWTANPDGYVDYYNDRWYQLTGPRQQLGNESWQPILHPDDVQRVTDVWMNSINTGEDYQIELRLRDYSTGQYRWFLATAVPVRDSEGNISKWFGTTTDIQEQKSITEKLEDLVAQRTQELQRSNQDLQQFAHVASHDLQEPVRKIKVFGNRLADELKGTTTEKGTLYLNKMMNAVSRMGSMIDGILNYSSLSATHQTTEPVELNEVIQHVASDLEMVLQQKEATLKVEKLPTVQGMPVLLHQLFYNLVNNALKFSKKDVPPVIEVSGKEVDGFAEVCIKDNGIGFDPEYAHRIFESFTRLNPKDQYEGTGLGLSLCKKIAERHGGGITATGEEGRGARFCVRLPLAEDKQSL